jgi:hypothetical protein
MEWTDCESSEAMKLVEPSTDGYGPKRAVLMVMMTMMMTMMK